MNTPNYEQLGVRIDRLVDGELSSDEYRALLGDLELQPGGWRQCALVFLESQALRSDLTRLRAARPSDESSPMAQSTDAPARADEVVPAVTTTVSGRRSKSYWLSLAASWVVVFVLGTGAARLWRDPPTQPIREGANQPGTNQFVDSPNAVLPGVSQVTDDANAGMIAEFIVSAPDGRGSQVLRMPVDLSKDLNQLMAEAPDDVTPKMRGLLRQKGLDVRPGQRYLYPFTMPNGRSMVVPVDSYQFVPVRKAY